MWEVDQLKLPRSKNSIEITSGQPQNRKWSSLNFRSKINPLIDQQRLSATTVQMTRNALLNIIRNGVSYVTRSRTDCGIRNLTLEEQNAKEMMFRFRVRINQRKKTNLSRTLRGPYKTRRLVLTRSPKLLQSRFSVKTWKSRELTRTSETHANLPKFH